MPSLVAHATMGYVIYRISQAYAPQHREDQSGPLPQLLTITVGLSLVPDVDVVPGILIHDLGRFHNNISHSFFLGLVVAAVVGCFSRVRYGSGLARWFIVALLCYELHLVMDFFTIGRGIMALWPFMPNRFGSSLKLFYGLRWSEGWISIQHIWTVGTEMGFVVLTVVLTRVLIRGTRYKKDSMSHSSPGFMGTWGLGLWLIAALFLALFIWWINTPQPALDINRNRLIASSDWVLAGGKEVSVFATKQEPVEVPRFGVFELVLAAEGSYPNPYLLMPGDNDTPGFVVGTFTGPNGETISIDGFWDGGNSWKIRMAPTAEGTWTYTTSSSDPGLDGRTGSFICIPSSSKGFVRVNPAYPHHFMWDDGTPFYWSPTALMIAHFDTRDAQGNHRRVDDGSFQALADIRAVQGFNVVHWGYYGFNKPQFNQHSQQNEGGAPFEGYDPDLLNPAYYQYGDQRVRALLERGIVPQFALGWPDQGILSQIGHGRLKRYWRYLIARYAAYNITYNLFGEVQEFGSDYLSIASDYAALTRKWDPYDHLLSTHTVGSPAPEMVTQPWLDYIMLQRETSATSNYLVYSKPVVNAEYGGYEDFQVNGEALRALLWDVRMHGGYVVYESWGDDPESTGAQYAALINHFFQERTRFWLLEYHPEIFGGEPGLADPGKEYVVYLPRGGSVSADLVEATGILNVEWYNPRTGGINTAGTTTGGAVSNFTAPDTNDWTLHIVGAVGNQTSTVTPTPTNTPTVAPTGTPSPTPTPTATPTVPASQCVYDVNANKVVDVADIMATVAELPCRVYVPLLVTHWQQAWSTVMSAVGGGLIADIVVSNGRTYEIDTLASGKLVYTDRSYTFTSVPAIYQDQEFIRTANNDKSATEPAFLAFALTTDATVYVAYDNRATSLPAWLDASWILTGDVIGTSDVAHRVYKKDFPAGPVTLGGNAMPPMADAQSGYNVIVIPARGPPP